MSSPINGGKLQFRFEMVAVNDKTNMVALRAVRFLHSDVWYGFPLELQATKIHPELMAWGRMKYVPQALSKRGHYRNITATNLPDEIYSLYVDDGDNFFFKTHFLGEVDIAPIAPSVSDLPVASLTACLERLAVPRPESIDKIMKHVLLEKFSMKCKNVENWCDRFQAELSRFNVNGRRQAEMLKSCLDSSLETWFLGVQSKVPTDADFSYWRIHLISCFADVSYANVHSAYSFRYLGGSLLTYVFQKEKMIMDLNRDYPPEIILDNIISGLPFKLAKILNRNNVTTIDLLYEKLKKYEADHSLFADNIKTKVSIVNNTFSNSTKSNSYADKIKSNVSKKLSIKTNNVTSSKSPYFKSCGICEKRGYPNKNHSENVCWHRPKEIKSINNVIVDDSISDSLQKND